MTIQRNSTINIHSLKDQPQELYQLLFENMEDNEEMPLIQLAKLLQVYNAAMKEISTKLEVLDEEFHLTHEHNPIHHMECRIKSMPSIYKKVQKYGISANFDSIREHIQDIAGIRVVCNYIDDIYVMEKLLLNQADITLVKRKDYIAKPKPNGYRSLHIIARVPVYLSSRTEHVPVEVQLRTIAMDYWASLEHMLRYKNNESNTHNFSKMLLDCANSLADTEKTMQYIREHIEDEDK